MELEINSQGEIIENLVNRYIRNYCVLADIPLVISNIVIVASGSSHNAGMFGKYFFEEIAQTKTSVEFASEFAYSKLINYDKDTLFIFISQSGASSDTVVSMQKIQQKGYKTLCITNDSDSIIYKTADYKFDIEAGVERAIAATKTFSATTTMLWILALKIAQNNHLDISEEVLNIRLIRRNIEDTISNLYNLDLASKYIAQHGAISICGFEQYYPLALEAALKIKETGYIDTHAYPIGEFIHGHFAILNKSKLFMTFLTKNSPKAQKDFLRKIISTYKVRSIVVSDVYEDYDCDILVKFPAAQSKIATILNMIVTMQLLAFQVAMRLKRDIDKPLGLDKVVIDKEI